MFCIEEKKNEKIIEFRIFTSPCTRNNYHYFLNHIFSNQYIHTFTQENHCNAIRQVIQKEF